MLFFPNSMRKTAESVFKATLRIEFQRKSNYIVVSKDCKWGNWSTGDKWNYLKHQLLCSLFEDKKGCLITSHSEALDMIVSDFTTIIQKRGQISGITYVLPKEKWTRMDLKKLATSKHFNNMDFWMSPSLDAKSALEMTGADIDYFWKSLVMPKLDDNPPCSKKEFMGGFRNGTCIMWSNPSPKIVDSVLNDFKKLASSLKFPIEEF